MEVQEALPPAGVIGAEPLTLVPQHFPRKPAQRCLRATAANLGFFDRLQAEDHFRPQSVKKVEVQEALPPARVIGPAPLTLVPQHFPRKPVQRCLRATAANLGFFDRLRAEEHFRP